MSNMVGSSVIDHVLAEVQRDECLSETATCGIQMTTRPKSLLD